MNWSKVFIGVGRYVLIGLASVIALIPVVWMATMAFKPREEWTSGIEQLSWLPKIQHSIISGSSLPVALRNCW